MDGMLKLQLVGDPSKTRTASVKSFSKWSKVPDMDPARFRGGAGKDVWEVITPEYIAKQKEVKAAPTRPIVVPDAIKRIQGNESEAGEQPEQPKKRGPKPQTQTA